jgi:hypothetical protein
MRGREMVKRRKDGEGRRRVERGEGNRGKDGEDERRERRG